MAIGGRLWGRAGAARRARIALVLALACPLCPLRAAGPDVAPPPMSLGAPQLRAAWVAEGGQGYGRREGGRERMERREAQHEEHMRRRREAWERRERMTPEERRGLRRDLHDANRDLYRP